MVIQGRGKKKSYILLLFFFFTDDLATRVVDASDFIAEFVFPGTFGPFMAQYGEDDNDTNDELLLFSRAVDVGPIQNGWHWTNAQSCEVFSLYAIHWIDCTSVFDDKTIIPCGGI